VRRAFRGCGVADFLPSRSLIGSRQGISPSGPPGATDLVCWLDCLHDMGDPVGTETHVRHALADDGTWLLVEPIAGDRPEGAHNSVGRVFLAGSTILCTPRPRSPRAPTPSATRWAKPGGVNSSARWP
jgi:hypothetical protein